MNEVFLRVHSLGRDAVTTWFIVLCLAIGGCTKPSTTVSGSVLLDGKPLVNASIDFFPTAGDGQTAGATTDSLGRYHAEVSPTMLSVTITATEVIGTKKNTDPAFPDIETIDVVKQVVPTPYTQRHTTTLSVQPEAGKNTLANFELFSTGPIATQ